VERERERVNLRKRDKGDESVGSESPKFILFVFFNLHGGKGTNDG